MEGVFLLILTLFFLHFLNVVATDIYQSICKARQANRDATVERSCWTGIFAWGTDLFNIVDLANTGLIFVCIALIVTLRFKYWEMLESYPNQKVDPHKYRDMTLFAKSVVVYRQLSGVQMFTSVIKCFKFLQLSDGLMLVWRLLGAARKPLQFLAIFTGILLVAFFFLVGFLFGAESLLFCEFLGRAEFLIKLTMADFEAYELIREISPAWAFAFLITFVVLIPYGLTVHQDHALVLSAYHCGHRAHRGCVFLLRQVVIPLVTINVIVSVLTEAYTKVNTIKHHKRVHRDKSFIKYLIKGTMSMTRKLKRAYRQKQRDPEDHESVHSDSVRILEFIESVTLSQLPQEECHGFPKGMALPEVIREDTFRIGMRKLQIKTRRVDWLVREYRFIPEDHIAWSHHGKRSFHERVEHQLHRQELSGLATIKALERQEKAFELLLQEVHELRQGLVSGASGQQKSH